MMISLTEEEIQWINTQIREFKEGSYLGTGEPGNVGDARTDWNPDHFDLYDSERDSWSVMKSLAEKLDTGT